jgi:hypothetical protein
MHIFTKAVLNLVGPVARIVTGQQTFIHTRIDPENSLYRLYKFVAGSATELGTSPFTLPNGSDFVLGLKVADDIAQVYENGVLIIEEEVDILGAGSIGYRLAANFGESNTTGTHLSRMLATAA